MMDDKFLEFENDGELAGLRILAKERLSEYRYRHTVGVARAAAALAERYGCSVRRAYKAGLLHDICKDLKKEEQLAEIIRYVPDFELSEPVWYASPSLWHSRAGALYARYELNETDEEIINAVRYHTSARAGMSRLEEIVYLADLVSEDRDYPDVDEMRRLSMQGIDAAMLYALKYIIGELTRKEKLISPETAAAYDHYALAAGRAGQKTNKYVHEARED